MNTVPWHAHPEAPHDTSRPADIGIAVRSIETPAMGRREEVYGIAASGIVRYRGTFRGLEAGESRLLVAMEQRGYAEEAPDFTDQLHDATRTNQITYAVNDRDRSPYYTSSGYGARRPPITEHEALTQLNGFFQFFDKCSVDERVTAGMDSDDLGRLQDAIEESRELRESFTFVGEKELTHGVKVLADYYHAYLKANPGASVVLHSGISNLQHGGDNLKSDEYIARLITQQLAEAEYQDVDIANRVFDHVNTYVASGRSGPVKLAVIDDWSISEHQIKKSITEAERLIEHANVAECDIEVNLLAARESQLRGGITVGADEERRYPVRAVYKTKHDTPHITGAHSTVDYGFASVLGRMGRALIPRSIYARDNGVRLPEIGLTNIVRSYWPRS